MRWLADRYDSLLGWSLEHRWVVILLALGVFATLLPLSRSVGFNFIPQDDSSEFEVSLQTAEGTDLERTVEICVRSSNS